MLNWLYGDVFFHAMDPHGANHSDEITATKSQQRNHSVANQPAQIKRQQPKQRQGLLTHMFKKKEPAAVAEPETIDLS